jgi:hypothetical protein
MYHLVLRRPPTPSTDPSQAGQEASARPSIEADGTDSSRLRHAPCDPRAAPRPYRRPRSVRVHPRSDAPLDATQHAVLRLIHLDPRLTADVQRERLVALVAVFLPQSTSPRVGAALEQLRRWVTAAAVDTDAFRAAAIVGSPDIARCRRLFNALVHSARPGSWPAPRVEQASPTVAALLGHPVDPTAPSPGGLTPTSPRNDGIDGRPS